jgi:hypothetical protein
MKDELILTCETPSIFSFSGRPATAEEKTIGSYLLNRFVTSSTPV